ncbi:response regulator [Paracoccus sp. WLY502]|uniref:response regulator n=1 Tax=Paracoccus yibinensis TaxID=3068891 RepID=UPI0027964F9A|nr:response regulator [Paracoccus sp. WLY502]MDQ1902654.1 response regulator [Paracoccus sp. WLY502]
MDQSAFYALVADDSPLIRMDAQAILTDAGFRVFGAAGGEEALEILATHGHGIKLLFTDVQMPPGTLTGFDLARCCASAWPHIGILVASGATLPGSDDLPERAVFIEKPFDDALVKRQLKRILPEQQQPPCLRTSLP